MKRLTFLLNSNTPTNLLSTATVTDVELGLGEKTKQNNFLSYLALHYLQASKSDRDVSECREKGPQAPTLNTKTVVADEEKTASNS